MKISSEELRYRQSLPLSVKVKLTEMRLFEFITYYGEENVYISVSGGKDSYVLYLILQGMQRKYKIQTEKITAFYCNTYFEFPECRNFVKENISNLITVRPDKPLKDIIGLGWCFPSKEVATLIAELRNPNSAQWAIRKINGLDKNGNASEFRSMYKKWWKLVDADIPISPKCCWEMKEKYALQYEKETGKKPILALMATESSRRANAYQKTGCNSFDNSYVYENGTLVEKSIQRPTCKPMGFWTENDVLEYVYLNNVLLAKPYGKVVIDGQLEGQLTLAEYGMSDACKHCKFHTTGEDRTGCICCPIAGHLDNFAKLTRLRSYNEKLYDYCMEELGEKKLVEWVRKNIIA